MGDTRRLGWKHFEMIRLFATACVSLSLVLPAAAHAAEITATLLGKPLHLPLPDGYCAADPAKQPDTVLLEHETKGLGSANQVLGVAVDCTELNDFRNGHNHMAHYVTFAAPLQNGQPIARSDSERQELIDTFVDQMTAADVQKAAEAAKKQTNGAATAVDIQRLWLVGQDEAAAYVGGVATHQYAQGQSLVNTTATAATVAGGGMVTANFHGDNPDDAAIAGMVELARHEARALIAANESGGAAAVSAAAAAALSPLQPRDPVHLVATRIGGDLGTLVGHLVVYGGLLALGIWVVRRLLRRR